MLKMQTMIICSLTAIGMIACKSQDSTTEKTASHEGEPQSGVVSVTREQLQLMKIEVGQPETRQLEGYISAPAKVEPIPTRIADIGTLISGRVQKIYVTEGEHVKTGQVLLEIQGLQIGEIKGEYIRSRGALEFAKVNFERNQKLLGENIAPKRAFDEAKAAYEEAKAAFIAADQKLHSIGITDKEAASLAALAISKNGEDHNVQSVTLKIASPISGVISKFHVEIGRLLNPDEDVMEVINTSSFWLSADIYEKNLADIQLGQRVDVMTEAYPEDVYNGKLEYISPVVDKETRTVKVRSTIQNNDGKLKPEMFATMRIFRQSTQESVVVPVGAVQHDGQIEFVFVLQPDIEKHDAEMLESVLETAQLEYRFRKQPVQTGLRLDGFVEIKAGLKGEEKVAMKGAFFLKSALMKESFGEEGEEH